MPINKKISINTKFKYSKIKWILFIPFYEIFIWKDRINVRIRYNFGKYYQEKIIRIYVFKLEEKNNCILRKQGLISSLVLFNLI